MPIGRRRSRRESTDKRQSSATCASFLEDDSSALDVRYGDSCLSDARRSALLVSVTCSQLINWQGVWKVSGYQSRVKEVLIKYCKNTEKMRWLYTIRHPCSLHKQKDKTHSYALVVVFIQWTFAKSTFNFSTFGAFSCIKR